MVNIKIKDIPISDRPRERLINNGVEFLSNEELLSIILRSGTKNISAKLLSLKILKEFGGLKELKNADFEQLVKIKGVGKSKACLLLAVFELNKRIFKSIDNINNVKLNNSQIVYEYYKNKISDKLQEHFYCLYLDNNKKIIREKLLFIGTINQSLVHPREIFKEAYIVSASAIICIHNHPSGNIMPSGDDINLTNRLIEIGKLLGIRVVDHIIIGKNNYYSFVENGDIV